MMMLGFFLFVSFKNTLRGARAVGAEAFRVPWQLRPGGRHGCVALRHGDRTSFPRDGALQKTVGKGT